MSLTQHTKLVNNIRNIQFAATNKREFFQKSTPWGNLAANKCVIHITIHGLSPKQITTILGSLPVDSILDINEAVATILCNLHTPDIVTHLCTPMGYGHQQKPQVAQTLPGALSSSNPRSLYKEGFAKARIGTRGLPNSVTTRMLKQLGVKFNSHEIATKKQAKVLIRIPAWTRAVIKKTGRAHKSTHAAKRRHQYRRHNPRTWNPNFIKIPLKNFSFSTIQSSQLYSSTNNIQNKLINKQ